METDTSLGLYDEVVYCIKCMLCGQKLYVSKGRVLGLKQK